MVYGRDPFDTDFGPADVDPRVGAPDCDCGHTSMEHHGEERTLTGAAPNFPRTGIHTGCKRCTWCDYYKATSWPTERKSNG